MDMEIEIDMNNDRRREEEDRDTRRVGLVDWFKWLIA